MNTKTKGQDNSHPMMLEKRIGELEEENKLLLDQLLVVQEELERLHSKKTIQVMVN